MTALAARRCCLCPLHEGVPGVVLDGAGVCNHCSAAARASIDRARHHVDRLLRECRARGLPVVVGLSGGNDSAACLTYLVRSKGVLCIAVLVDNGFIPDGVKLRARALCERLGVELHLEAFDLLERLSTPAGSPCEQCMGEIIQRLVLVAARRHAGAIASGHLYGPGLMPAARGSLTVPRIAPLFADGLGEAARNALLAEVGWKDDIRYASSTNCTLLGFIDYEYSRRWGYSPAIGEIAHEVRAGTLDREQAIAHLCRPRVWQPEYADVERRLMGRTRPR